MISTHLRQIIFQLCRCRGLAAVGFTELLNNGLLQSLPSLRIVDLTGNVVTRIAFGALASLPNVTSLLVDAFCLSFYFTCPCCLAVFYLEAQIHRNAITSISAYVPVVSLVARPQLRMVHFVKRYARRHTLDLTSHAEPAKRTYSTTRAKSAATTKHLPTTAALSTDHGVQLI